MDRMHHVVNAFFFNPMERAAFEKSMDDLDAFMFGMGIHTSNLFARLTFTEWDTLKKPIKKRKK